MEATATIDKFKEFMQDYYKDKIIELDRKRIKLLNIDFMNIAKFDPELGEVLLDEPEDCIQAIKISLDDFDIEDSNDFNIGIINLPANSEININRIRQKHLNKLISIKGVVTTRTKVFPKVVSSKFECPACGNIIKVLQSKEIYKQPTKCGCGRKGAFTLIVNELKDTLMLKLEELPERLKGSEQPYEIRTILQDILCKEDYQIFLGSRMEVIGFLTELPTKVIKGTPSVNCDYLFNVVSYQSMDYVDFDITVSPEEEKLFDFISSRKNPAKFIARLIFNDIYGYGKVKQAVIYQQFSGSRIEGKRDYIHILLYGMPGTAKTDIALRTSYLNPISKVATGPSISGVGLTAAVKKDELTGNWVCVGGLLPRCNKGLAVIDEIEKMSDQDKKSLHMPMESGYFGVEKAGISAKLVTNTSILGTSNPKVVTEPLKVGTNCDLPASILDRFDLIFKFTDVSDSKTDTKIAENITNRSTSEGIANSFKDNNTTFEWSGHTFTISSIKKYIYISKNKIPKLSKRVTKEIHLWYANLRKTSEQIGFEHKKPTPRVVESILRLARAITRSKRKDLITKKELKLAIEFFDFLYDTEDGVGLAEEQVED